MDWFSEAEGLAQVKRKVAIGGPGLYAKCLGVESPEPSEADHEDGHPMEPMCILPSLPKVALS